MWRTFNAIVRILHGLALALGIMLAGGFLISVLRDVQRKPVSRTMTYVLLYAVALCVQLFIARCARRGFRTCSLRTSLISYTIWLVCFVSHGWFTEWAPFRLHEVLIPDANDPSVQANLRFGGVMGSVLLGVPDPMLRGKRTVLARTPALRSQPHRKTQELLTSITSDVRISREHLLRT